MRLTLRVVSQQSGQLGSNAAHTFGQEGGTIGRGKSATWVITDPDRFLSSQHARIEYRNNSFYLIDISTNGCFVNGAMTPLGRDNEHPLRSGDQIMIGDFQIAASIDSGPVQAKTAANLRPVGRTVLDQNSMSSDPLAALSVGAPPPPPPSSNQIIPDDWDPKTAIGGGPVYAQRGATAGVQGGGQSGGPSGSQSGSQSGGQSGGNLSAGQATTPAGGFGFGSRGGQGAVPPPAATPSPPTFAPSPVMSPPASQPAVSGGSERASMRPQRWDSGNDQGTDSIPVAASPFAASPVFNRGSASSASPTAGGGNQTPPPATPNPSVSATPAGGHQVSVQQTAPVSSETQVPPPYIPEFEGTPPPVTPGQSPATQTMPLPGATSTPSGGSATSVPRWPVRSSRSGEPAAPAPDQPHGQATQTGRSGSGMDPAVALFWQAVGLDPTNLSSSDMMERLSEAGAALRDMADSIVQILNARRMVKDEFRIHQTQLQPTRNNALKFLADGDTALSKMLVEHDQAFLPLSDSVREAFDDIKAHELATLAGMREALRSMLDQFSPAAVERKLESSNIGRNVKSKYGEALTELYNEIADSAEDRFRSVFGDAFSRAYAEQMVLIRQRRRGS